MMGKGDKSDGVVQNEPVPDWDKHFVPPDYLYRIIFVCLFIGFLLFLIFFALFRYLKWQNKQRAILRAQEEREREAEFPIGIEDGILCGDEFEGQNVAGDGLDEIPLGVTLLDGLGTDGGEEGGGDDTKECTCSPRPLAVVDEEACVCQPLNPSSSSNSRNHGLNKEQV